MKQDKKQTKEKKNMTIKTFTARTIALILATIISVSAFASISTKASILIDSGTGESVQCEEDSRPSMTPSEYIKWILIAQRNSFNYARNVFFYVHNELDPNEASFIGSCQAANPGLMKLLIEVYFSVQGEQKTKQ